MPSDVNHPSRDSLLIVALAFTFCVSLICINLVGAQEPKCDRPEDSVREPQSCTGYEIATHSVWTKLQCLDECIRLPHCDKYIFNGTGNENCRLLNTGSVASILGARNLKRISGACAPRNFKIVQKFLLGANYCSHPPSNGKTRDGAS